MAVYRYGRAYLWARTSGRWKLYCRSFENLVGLHLQDKESTPWHLPLLKNKLQPGWWLSWSRYEPFASAIKIKVKVNHEGPEGEQMYVSTLPSTSALDWVWVVNATPRSLYPREKTRYPLYRKLGGPQGRSGRVRKILPPIGIRSPDRPASSESLYRLSYPGPCLLPEYM